MAEQGKEQARGLQQGTASSHVGSPAEDSPTTTQMMHALAQIPRHHLPSPEQELSRNTVLDERQTQQRFNDNRAGYEDDEHDDEGVAIDISDSGLGMFTNSSPSATLRESWLDTERPMPDDELPSYATSQAEAHAAQRHEAARRAEELQRRWREGGRKYGADY